uniref:uncharacterized protein n=1 Tax=Semicossyphus pulcher TaxID=241346 RepID=UPI0037E7A0F9
MSDLWPCSSSSHIIHHSSPTSPGNHGNPHTKVPSYQLTPQTTVSSPYDLHQTDETHPHFPSPHLTSPTYLPHPEVSSPLLQSPQVTSPHFIPQTQVTSPHLLPQTQATSPHLPHPQAASPHFVPQPQITSPHLLYPPQQNHFFHQNHDPLVHPSWSRSDPAADLSYLQQSYTYQNQTTAHLDLQTQTQFSSGFPHHRDDLQRTHSLSYNTHTLFDRQGDTPGSAQDTWGPLESTLPQLQCSLLGSTSGEVPLGGWSSVEFNSIPSEDFTQFFSNSYHDNSAPQPFCSPNTPGPSPHYPQTPTVSSPGPQMHHREERLDLHTQTSRHLNGDKTLTCFLPECDSFAVTSDPHQTSQDLLQSQSELNQNQTTLFSTSRTSESCFSPQRGGRDVRDAARPEGLPAGLSWREERGRGRGGRGGGGGGGGGKRRRRRGGGGQTDWTMMKQLQPEHSTKVLDSRLLCTVCKRDFRSLPALNGHMRSHSGSRSAASVNKVEDPSLLEKPSISMVMPVSVPVQSRGSAKRCQSGQRTCSRLPPATGGAVLYRSLMHKEGAVDEDGKAARDGDAEVAEGVHFTPPPMLCPLRAGPGLFCSLTTRRQQRAQTVQLHNAHDELSDVVAMETSSPPPRSLTSGSNNPRINIGRGFQAEIPPLQGQKDLNSHNALLLWMPLEELEHPANQERVEALLMMSCSSVMPGGGASTESALQVLSESRGDFLLSVERLLSSPETFNTAQQYTSAGWSAAERRLLVKSLQLHQKDFRRIQKTVQTKSLSQCVEFYYRWKKKLSLSARTPAGLTVTLPDTNGQRSRSRSHDAS